MKKPAKRTGKRYRSVTAMVNDLCDPAFKRRWRKLMKAKGNYKGKS